MANTTHLTALETRLSNERAYLSKETTEQGKRLRAVWIAQIEKEISNERDFLGLSDNLPDLSVDELYAELAAA